MDHIKAQPMHCGGAYHLAGFYSADGTVILPKSGGRREVGVLPQAQGVPLCAQGDGSKLALAPRATAGLC